MSNLSDRLRLIKTPVWVPRPEVLLCPNIPNMEVFVVTSIDCETNGIDFRHSAKPFFVTTCEEDGSQRFWCWGVDPLTREPNIPEEDLDDIADIVLFSKELVLQNSKFDVTALASVRPSFADWPWASTQDTLIAGHLLASNLPHDLTSMAVQYLGVDIEPYEKAIEKACQESRRMARSKFPSWRIASADLPEMPSAKEKTWKFDMWLPRALALELGYKDSHPWFTLLSDYANADSAVTLALWKVMKQELDRRGLYEIYAERMKSCAVVFDMERRGVAFSRTALNDLMTEYSDEVERSSKVCVSIAENLGYELSLPKSGNNGSLTKFLFGTEENGGKDAVLKLPVLGWTDTGRPSLTKDIIEEYKKTLDGQQLEFITNLSAGRKRAKSNEFLESYLKFGIETDHPDVIRLHPSLNQTGTVTTRLSCSNPNLQQVSKQATECEVCQGEGCEECGHSGEDLHSVRRVFCPGPGRELWTIDATNIELRIPAYESGEPDLIALFEKANEPPYYGSQHILNFSIVYDDLWRQELKAVGFEKVGPHCKKKYAAGPYQFTKNGDFAIQYQCGRETADMAFRRPGFDKLKAKFTKLDALNTRCVKFAEKMGYVETLPDRTVNPKHGYPLLCSRGDRGKIVSTVPLNYRTQGTAGWWMIRAMNRCYEQLKEWNEDGFSGYMNLTVHDELVFDFPKGTGKEPWKTNLPYIRKIRRLMEQGGLDLVPSIPTPVSIEYRESNWSEGRTI